MLFAFSSDTATTHRSADPEHRSNNYRKLSMSTTQSTTPSTTQVLRSEIRAGVYYDSVILMQLQRALAALPAVHNAGVVMGTPANKEVLAQGQLLTEEAQRASAEDLVIVVAAADEAAATGALGQVDALLERRTTSTDVEYLPKSLNSAAKQLPAADWVLISVPGRYAADVARDALRMHKHVFLYSDNVSVEDEVALKSEAASQGLLVMGPDCGTAIVNGVGLGFANAVRRGSIGVVGASGTGLQAVTARIHGLGGGITSALGTGGRDLSENVGATTARQALDLLRRDPETQVIVLVSKPPAPAVAASLLRWLDDFEKPVVVNFIGYQPDPRAKAAAPHIHFANTLGSAAELAVALSRGTVPPGTDGAEDDAPTVAASAGEFARGQRYLRGLFSGGTLAYEALLLLQEYLPQVYSNVPLDKRYKLENATESRAHTVVDLGEDEFTVGRLHPMMDNELRILRLQQEAADPETAVILLDVVLGYGAHPDPAGELAPAIEAALATARADGRDLLIIATVIGTDADPQNFDEQAEALRTSGAVVEFSNESAVRRASETVRTLAQADAPPVALDVLVAPFAAINVGLEFFTDSLRAQGADVVHVDWRPPAGGNARLAGILARMRG